MNKLLLAVPLALVLSACAGNSIKTTEYGCIAATGAAYAVATYNNTHPFTATEQASLLKAADEVDTVCSAPTPATDAQLKSLGFQEAAALLVAEAAKLGAK